VVQAGPWSVHLKGDDTDRKKSASCERLKSARAAGVFFIVSLAKFFSNRFLRCLV
jgi:hypothetical protein